MCTKSHFPNKILVLILSLGILWPWANSYAAGATTAGSTNAINNVVDTQAGLMKQAAQQSQDGQSKADMISMITKAMGLANIAQGGMQLQACMASTPVSGGCIAAAIAKILQGMMNLVQAEQAKQGANALGNAAGINTGNMGNLDSLSKVGAGNLSSSTGGGISFNKDLLNDAGVQGILDDMAKKTGISKNDFLSAVAKGTDPLSMVKGLSKSDANKYMAQAKSMLASNPSAGLDAFNKSGLDKVAKRINDANLSGASSIMAGGGMEMANSKEKPVNPSDFLKDLNAKPDPNALNGLNNPDNISADLKNNLAENGITDKSIFELVSNGIHRKESMLRGSSPEPMGQAAQAGGLLGGGT